MQAEISSVIGRLSASQSGVHASTDSEQIRAWSREVEILRRTFGSIGAVATEWSLLLEAPLTRLGKRLDAVILVPGVVLVVEFKIGAKAFEAQDRWQTEQYGQALRDFHQVSQSQVVVPILCAEMAQSREIEIEVVEGVADLCLCNAQTLEQAVRSAVGAASGAKGSVSAAEFDYSAYNPTPTIIEAAQALYAGHQIADIGRGDASDFELQRTAAALREIVAEAEAKRRKVICFVTGTPGAGKTLLGLDLALMKRSGETPSALLSGNRPLVHVLTEALAADSAARLGVPKKRARYEADAAIQNLLRYLREHTDGPPPPENVIVFDEAQRAWDAEVGKRLMGRPESEPDLFLQILNRLEWACLVCLVGPGQEINRGEGGLELWGEALARASKDGGSWEIIAATQAILGGPDVAGAGLSGGLGSGQLKLTRDDRLHLASSMRAYRNPLHGQWVAALLESDVERAISLAGKMAGPPALLTRSLAEARDWLRKRRRGGRSVGLLCSSGGSRLVGEGLPPAPLSNELDAIGHWFLRPFTDFRSSGALEIPMSEFACQGLELDFTGVCWDGDLIWKDGSWSPRIMRAPNWQTVRDVEKKSFRLNGYRVLLTRGRAGSIIYVPEGNSEDATRSPAQFNAIANVLQLAGCQMLGDAAAEAA